MATFAGRAIKNTYGNLLNIDNANVGVDSTVRTIQDGEGTQTQFSMSTTIFRVGTTGKIDGAGSAEIDMTNFNVTNFASSLTASGIIEIATIAETNTGTDATRAVSPDGLEDWTGSAQLVTVGTLSSGDVTTQVSAASISAAGKVEIATGAETNTGTDATRAVSPDGLNDWTGSAFITTLGAIVTVTSMDLGDGALVRPTIKDYGETVNAIGDFSGGAQAIDISLGNVATATVSTSEVTFTFTNPSDTGKACSLTVILTNGGSQTTNWPASVDWPSAVAPTLTTSGVDILTFITTNAGVLWHGFTASLDSK